MIQCTVSHPAGRFARCRVCGTEPRHIRSHGRSHREPIAFGPIAPRHSLECRCGSSTARHGSLCAAEVEWGADYAQLTLPLHAARRRKAAA
jgi:hypothetical protein